MAINMKKVRIQLTELEVKILRNMLANGYHTDKNNLRYTKRRVARGEADSPIYPIGDRERNLRKTAALLKKLNKHIDWDIKWFQY